MNLAQQLRKQIEDKKSQELQKKMLKEKEAEKRRAEYEYAALQKLEDFKRLVLLACTKNNTGKLIVDSEIKEFAHFNCGFDTELILNKMGDKLKEYFIEQGFRVIYEWNAKVGGRYTYYDCEGSGSDWEDKYGPRLTLEW